MIQLTTLPAPGAIAMPRPPGSPLATTSDFALALATISAPAGVTVVAPVLPDDGGVAVVAPGEVRQAVAATGTILPVVAGDVASEEPAAVELLPAKAPRQRRRMTTEIALPAKPEGKPAKAKATEDDRAITAPVPTPVPALTVAALPDVPILPETQPIDPPPLRERASVDATTAAPGAPVAAPAAPIVMPSPVTTMHFVGERVRSAPQPAGDPAMPSVPAAVDAAPPAPTTQPVEGRPAQPQPVVIETPAATIPVVADPVAVTPPTVVPAPRSIEHRVAMTRDPVVLPLAASPSSASAVAAPRDATASIAGLPADIAAATVPSDAARPVIATPVARQSAPATVARPTPPVVAESVPATAARPSIAVPTIRAETIVASVAPPAPEPVEVRAEPAVRVPAASGPAARIAIATPPANTPTLPSTTDAAPAPAVTIEVETAPAPTPGIAAAPIAKAIVSPRETVRTDLPSPMERAEMVSQAPAPVAATPPAGLRTASLKSVVPDALPSLTVPRAATPVPVVVQSVEAPPVAASAVLPREIAPPAPPPPIVAQPVAAPVRALAEATPSSPVAPLPTSPAIVAAPVAVPVAIAPAPAPALATPTVVTPPLSPAPGKRTAAPIIITVAPPARSAPPAPAQQPAAQAFAAAMFAAGRPTATIDHDDPAAELTAAFPMAGLASPTAPTAVPLAGATQQPALDLARDDWMGSMIDRIETIRDDAGVRETRIRLTPDALGSVDVSIAQDDAGVLQVRFDADTPQARAILAEAAPRLAEMAEARGLKLGGAGVDAGADQRRQNAQQSSAPVPSRPAGAANDDIDTDDSRIA